MVSRAAGSSSHATPPLRMIRNVILLGRELEPGDILDGRPIVLLMLHGDTTVAVLDDGTERHVDVDARLLVRRTTATA